MGKFSSPEGLPGAGAGCPGERWSPHPWGAHSPCREFGALGQCLDLATLEASCKRNEASLPCPGCCLSGLWSMQSCSAAPWCGSSRQLLPESIKAASCTQALEPQLPRVAPGDKDLSNKQPKWLSRPCHRLQGATRRCRQCHQSSAICHCCPQPTWGSWSTASSRHIRPYPLMSPAALHRYSVPR